MDLTLRNAPNAIAATTSYAPASTLLAPVLLPAAAPDFSLAALCHAGMVALRSLRSVGWDEADELSCFGAGGGGGPFASALGVVVPPLVDAGPSFGFSFPFPFPFPFPFVAAGCWLFHAGGVDTPPDLPTLFSSSFFRLCISWPSSSSFASPAAFHPSRALGTCSFRPWIWSAMILLSASRRLFASLRSSITVSTSFKVVSSFCVRWVSFSFRSAVSVVSWSIKAKARLKEASMEALSASSWGGVGGEISGRT